MTSPQFTPPTEIIELGDLPTPDVVTARQLVGLLHGGDTGQPRTEVYEAKSVAADGD